MENSNAKFRIVFCNTDSLESAKQIASNLIEKNLAACVSIIQNVLSVYRWEDKIESRGEFTLKIKTSKFKLDDLKQEILKVHPDNVPEILSVEIKEGLASYLNWLDEELS